MADLSLSTSNSDITTYCACFHFSLACLASAVPSKSASIHLHFCPWAHLGCTSILILLCHSLCSPVGITCIPCNWLHGLSPCMALSAQCSSCMVSYNGLVLVSADLGLDLPFCCHSLHSLGDLQTLDGPNDLHNVQIPSCLQALSCLVNPQHLCAPYDLHDIGLCLAFCILSTFLVCSHH